MTAPRRNIVPREGLYIDPIAKLTRKVFLNPFVSVPLAIVLHWKQGAAKFPILQTLLKHRYFSTTVQILALLGVVLNINDYLDKNINNNWVRDDSWDWDHEIVLITGGSSGIGSSVAQELVARNKKTTVVILDYSALDFSPKRNDRIHYYRCDLSNSSEIKSVCAQVRKEVGDPTVVFSNAGLTRGATVMEGTYSDVEVTFKTNAIAPFLILKEFLPAMVRRNHGHIIATSSMSSIIPPAGIADYAATKAGLALLHESLAQELKHKHNAPKVRLSLAILSFVATPMFKGRTNQPWFITPLMHVDTVGERIVDVLYSGYGRNIYLPGLMRYISCVRGLPSWMGRVLADGTQKLSVDYVGRQKVNAETGTLE